MKMTSLFAPLAVAAMLAVASLPALAASDEETERPIAVDLIEGITWQLQQQAVEGQLGPIPSGISVTLNMNGGEAGGEGGCNLYFANYTLDGDALSFSDIGGSQMFCEGDGSAVESAYFANLEAVATAFSTGGSLIMTDAAGETILEFTPGAAPPIGADGPEGVTWLLTHQASSVDDVLGEARITLLMQDGQAVGDGGCNSYFTSYVIDGAALTFGMVGSTAMACAPPLMDREAAYVDDLAAVASWAIESDRLVLFDAGGAAILEYEAAPEVGITGSWTASGINNGVGGVDTTEFTPLVTAEFTADGDLTGFDGCNNYFTTYRLDGESISIAPEIGNTRMACTSDALDAQVQQYYAALVAATTWAVGVDGALELRDDGGALQVRYESAAS